jgi:glutaminyl-peptide cyclotransferase
MKEIASRKRKTSRDILFILIFVILVGSLIGYVWINRPSLIASLQPKPNEKFDGNRAFQDVKYQVDLGPRTVGSSAHDQARDWIVAQLKEAGWSSEVQSASRLGHPIQNVVGKWGSGHPLIVLGAHYDSRLLADQDPDPQKRTQPVLGANDGASGVAVLLELARTLPHQLTDQSYAKQIWLVFIDNEDNGNIQGWDWLLGSRAFVDDLKEYPDAAVIVDMIGDSNLNIYEERNSNPELIKQIWQQAADLGYAEEFIPQYKYRMLDDHIPFIEAGIPAVDLIDFDYPYWHTTQDTLDKVSARSLEIVGRTLSSWLTLAK